MVLRVWGRQMVIESLAPWPQFWFSHNCRGTFDYRYSLGLWFYGIWWGKSEQRTSLIVPCEGMPVRDAAGLLARTTIASYEDASFLLEVLYGKRREAISLLEYEQAKKIICGAGQSGLSLCSLSCAILALQRRDGRNKPGERGRHS